MTISQSTVTITPVQVAGLGRRLLLHCPACNWQVRLQASADARHFAQAHKCKEAVR